MNAPKPNEEQNAAIRQLIQFVDDPKTQYATLSGGAGTGKSFTVGAFIRALAVNSKLTKTPMPKVLVTAPTHKAVAVIADFITVEQLDVKACTLHSALGLHLSADGEVKSTVSSGRSIVAQYDLIVVDEGSMVSESMFRHLVEAVPALPSANPDAFATSRRRVKVLFMGDMAQLKPVKSQDLSPTFRFLVCDLTKQMRQFSGNPIAEPIAQARAAVKEGVPLPTIQESLNEEGDGVHTLRGKKFEAAVLSTFEDEAERENCKILAWTNREVDKWNRKVRDHLYPDAGPIFEGEHLIVQDPVYDISPEGFKELMFHVEQEVVVTGCSSPEIMEVNIGTEGQRELVGFKMFAVHARANVGPNVGKFWVLHPSEKARFARVKANLAKEARAHQKQTGSGAMWKAFWSLAETFTNVRQTFATTVHKSQGSSYDNVFVVQTDLLRIPDESEFNRLAYVAYSRARANIVLNSGKTYVDKMRQEERMY